jgi:proteasome accessory factor C
VKRGRPGAVERVQRVLELVPWIAAQDGPTRAEICEHFGITDAELTADLSVVWYVGLPPYTPDSLIDVIQEDDRVWIRYPDVFERPQKLTPEQGLALLTAGASLLALPGSDRDGPLARGVAKLARVLDVADDAALEVDLGSGRPEVVAALQQAIAARARVELDYYAYGRDERTRRRVDPYRLHAEQGALYLAAHCHLAGGARWFRLDRIQDVRVLDEHFDEPASPPPASVFDPDPDDPRLTLELAPSAAWVAEHYPTEHVERRADGSTRVTLVVSARAWLERLLLTLGDQAQVVDAPGDLAGAGRDAARRVLRRYTLPGG